MTLSRPTTVHYAFASSASPVNINSIPDTPTGSYLASWQQGFPPVTMTPLAGGGSPPAGADFNGVLNALSANAQWVNAGGLPVFDAALSAAIGGYPVGVVLALNDGFGLVQCTTAGNTSDPNSAPVVAGWAPVGGVLAGAANLAVDASVSANVVTLTTRIPFTSATLRDGMVIQFIKAGPTNSGAVSITVNGASSLITDSAGQALPAGALVQGVMYFVQYVAATGWLLMQPSIATTAQAQAQTDTTHFLSPAGLKAALQGANQSLAIPGYQKLPGGLILQWGRYTGSLAPNGGFTQINFPTAFTSLCFGVFPVVVSTAPSPNASSISPYTDGLTTAHFTAFNYDPDTTITEFRWFAIGF